MNITDVRIRKINKVSNMKAIVSITLDDAIAIHDIKVIEGEKGFFIAMPSIKTKIGEFKDIVHPINSEARQILQNIILDKYKQVLLEESAFLESAITEE